MPTILETIAQVERTQESAIEELRHRTELLERKREAKPVPTAWPKWFLFGTVILFLVALGGYAFFANTQYSKLNSLVLQQQSVVESQVMDMFSEADDGNSAAQILGEELVSLSEDLSKEVEARKQMITTVSEQITRNLESLRSTLQDRVERLNRRIVALEEPRAEEAQSEELRPQVLTV
jgi:hypothetical protein